MRTQRRKVMKVSTGSKAKRPLEQTQSDMSKLFENEDERLGLLTYVILTEAAQEGSKLASTFIDAVVIDSNDEIVKAGIRRFSEQVNKTTRDRLLETIHEGYKAGEAMDSIVNRVKEVMNVREKEAKMIARTETGSMIHSARYDYDKKAGVTKKEWIGGTRPSHAAINGQVKNLDEPFGNGLMYPGDPSGPAEEVVNCMCTYAPIVQ